MAELNQVKYSRGTRAEIARRKKVTPPAVTYGLKNRMLTYLEAAAQIEEEKRDQKEKDQSGKKAAIRRIEEAMTTH